MFGEDRLYSVDIEKRIKEVEEELEQAKKEYDTAGVQVCTETLRILQEALNFCNACGGILISENNFEEWAEEEAQNIYDIDFYSWPFRHVNWVDAANELLNDYTSIDILGDIYYGRKW